MIELYQKFTEKFGHRVQIIKAIEEMSELQKELCKYLLTGTGNLTAITEEITDVTIMLDQLKQIFAISEEMINHVRDFKHKRMEGML